MFPSPASPAPSAGVCVPSVPVPRGGTGVVAPELACVARTEAASFLVFSEMICLTFLLRRWEGRQLGLRKGRGNWATSRVSRRRWWASVSAGVGLGMVRYE